MDKDVSATKKKRKGLENSDLDGDEAAKGKKNTKRKTGLKKSKPFPLYAEMSLSLYVWLCTVLFRLLCFLF